MDNVIRLKDTSVASDSVDIGRKSGYYARTKITGGYDPYIDKRTGLTKFGTTLFETENMIVLGGSLFTLEKVFGVDYFSKGISSTIADELDIIKMINSNDEYSVSPTDHVTLSKVCLFGVGVTGAGESITDVYDVNYYERAIGESDVGGATFGLIPIRQTADPLPDTDKEKYWLRTKVYPNDVEKTAYYMKSFEKEPEIKVLFRNNDEDDGQALVGNGYNRPWVEEPTTPIETFIELTLKITKKDIREYFKDLNDTEKTRINTIGLFTGVKTQVGTDANGQPVYDYRDVRMFSKLNINNEMLTTSKDLTISYRIYTS